MTPNPMGLIDTHAHMCSPSFDEDRAEVLERARAAGIERVVAVGETLADAERNLSLAREHPELRVAAGLYPTVLDREQAMELIELIRRERDQIVAIGEVGLDRWKVKDEAGLEVQQEIFESMIDLAIELDLPVNVHSRSAGRQAIEVLLARGAKRVQMHAFDGRAAKAMPGVEAGFFFSVPPSIVRSQQKQKLVRRLPLECLLIETDSPVLGPEQGERNEPANAVRSLEAIAELKETSRDEVREHVINNTQRLYGSL